MCKGVSWKVVAQQAQEAKQRDALQNSIMRMIDGMAPDVGAKGESRVAGQDASCETDLQCLGVCGSVAEVVPSIIATQHELAMCTGVSWQLAVQQALEVQQRDAIVRLIGEMVPDLKLDPAIPGKDASDEGDLECLDVCGGLAHLVPPIFPTTVDSWNRHRDQARIHLKLGLPEQGDAHIMIVDPKQPGTVVGWGYLRVLYGDHGPYLELHHHQVCWASFPKVKRKCAKAYYDEHYTASGSIKLYEQRRPVTDKPNPPGGEWSCRNNRPGGYADYRSGLAYVSADAVRAVEEWKWRVAAVSGSALHDVLGKLVWPKTKGRVPGRRTNQGPASRPLEKRRGAGCDRPRNHSSRGEGRQARSPQRPSNHRSKGYRGRSSSRPCSPLKLIPNTRRCDRHRSVSTTSSTRSRSPFL
mmetsp:Transcript_40209/g.92432  ORF Transcript_40209/g.92432 Transcript_40209/m.92432 type:complete len:412 (+) Transcript_40209:54-1289(+)